MTKSKIEKWNLEEEVDRMLAEGKTAYAVAKHISEKYADIPELAKVNKMTISRHIKKKDEDRIENKLQEKKDPMGVVEQEFNTKMRQNILDAESMNQLVMSYKNKLDADDLTTKDLATMLKAWQTANDQMRKNLVSLREYTDNHIIKPTQNIIYKKEINVKNMLVDYARELCPECRKKISKIIDIGEDEYDL